MRTVSRGLLVAGFLLTTADVGAQTAQPSPSAKPPAMADPAGERVPPTFQMVMEPRAVDLIKAMSARLANARAMSFTATVGIEFPSRLGPPLVYSSVYEVTMRRPDMLRVIRAGDGPVSEFYYDGRTMVAYAPAEDLAATADAPPTIDGALKRAFETAAIYFPFTDLLLSDPGEPLLTGGKLAFHIGPSIAEGGVKTEMIGWADADVSLQIWIGADDMLPRRVRAIYRQDQQRLRHDMVLSNWQLDIATTAATFISEKAKAAKPITLADPIVTAMAAARAQAGASPGAAAAPGPATKPQ